MKNNKIFYREAKVTPDRPGAFLTLWQRPLAPEINNNKPIAIRSDQVEYLFVRVKESENDDAREGIFIFPVSILIEKKILSSSGVKGKTAFRVFPPWSADRGSKGMKIFSESAKNTQKWQIRYFLET